jgi:hypothetical protein
MAVIVERSARRDVTRRSVGMDMSSQQLIDLSADVKLLPETRATLPKTPTAVLFTLATIVLLGNAAAARDDRGLWMGGGVGPQAVRTISMRWRRREKGAALQA